MAYTYPFRQTDEATKLAVWNKGRVIPNFAPSDWRSDMCGMPMNYFEHGNTGSQHGWEIDHIKPVARDGSDSIDNLQPLQWENNRRKADNYPWNCV